MKKLLAVVGGGRPNGNTNGKLQIDKTDHLLKAYEFGKNIYKD